MSKVTQKVLVSLTVELELDVPIHTDPNEVLENMDYEFTPGDASTVVSTEITHWELKNKKAAK